MEKRSSGKYIKYALGEIILVIVGILLALQINEWKTEAEKRKIENNYYCQILGDLDIDRAQLSALTNKAKASIETGKKVIVGLHNFKYEKDELLKEYIKAVRTDFYVPTNATYTDLMSSGNLGLLKNNKLKRSLIQFHQDVENLNLILNDNKNLKIDNFTDWDNVLEMGWHSPSISPGLNLDQEIVDLLPKNNWHLEQENPYFIKFEEVVGMSMVIASREIELYKLIEDKIHPIYSALQKICKNAPDPLE